MRCRARGRFGRSIRRCGCNEGRPARRRDPDIVARPEEVDPVVVDVPEVVDVAQPKAQAAEYFGELVLLQALAWGQPVHREEVVVEAEPISGVIVER